MINMNQTEAKDCEIYELRQKIRGLKKLLHKVAPAFKIKETSEAIIIFSLNTHTGKYEEYIVFNLNIRGVDDEYTSFLANECIGSLQELGELYELAL